MKHLLTISFTIIAAWLAIASELRFKDAEIILPEKPYWTVTIAAEELQYHFRKMTGGEFPIVKKRTGKYESSIYLGDQPAAKKVSLSLQGIKRDGFLRSVKGKNLYVSFKNSFVCNNVIKQQF